MIVHPLKGSPMFKTIILFLFLTFTSLYATQNFTLIAALEGIVFPVPFTENNNTFEEQDLSFFAWDGIKTYESSQSKIKNYNDIVVYLNPVDEDENKFVENSEKLHEFNAKVWYLMSADPSLDYIQEQTDLIVEYNKDHEKKVIGMSFDMEPWTEFEDQNSSDNKEAWQDYLDFMSDAKDILHDAHLQISIAIPFWIDRVTEAFPNDRPINYDVIDIADEVIVMTYTTYADRVLPYARTSLIYADEHYKSIKIALEMVDYDNDDVSFYNHPEDIKEILDLPLPYLFFEGYMIHTLDSFDESGIEVEYTSN
jgi:hypothetical protein